MCVRAYVCVYIIILLNFQRIRNFSNMLYVLCNPCIVKSYICYYDLLRNF